MRIKLSCWYCKREQGEAITFDKNVIIDKHHIDYNSDTYIFLCRDCHKKLSNLSGMKLKKNPYLLYFIDGLITEKEAIAKWRSMRTLIRY